MTPKDAKVIEIQKLAFQIYIQRCREGRPGSAEDDWLQACELIKKQNSTNGRNGQSSAGNPASTRLGEAGEARMGRPSPVERRSGR